MTISYEVAGNRMDNVSCYGEIDDLLPYPGYDYDGEREFEEIRKPDFLEHFDGVTLHLFNPDCDRKYDELFMNGHTQKEQRRVLSMGNAIGFRGLIPYQYRKLKKDKFVHFDDSLPFYVVVGATGLFRFFAHNHPDLLKAYEMFRSKGLDAYEAFVCANTVRRDGTDKWKFYPNGEHSVVPWTICNRESLAKFRTWRDRMNDLQSMRDEYEETNYLSYRGRDEWFGCNTSWHDIAIYDMEDYADYGHECETIRHIVGDISEYSSNIVNINSLVEAVKAWR